MFMSSVNNHYCKASRINGDFFSHDRLQFGKNDKTFTIAAKDSLSWYDPLIACIFGTSWVKMTIREIGEEITERDVYLKINDLVQTLHFNREDLASCTEAELAVKFHGFKKIFKTEIPPLKVVSIDSIPQPEPSKLNMKAPLIEKNAKEIRVVRSHKLDPLKGEVVVNILDADENIKPPVRVSSRRVAKLKALVEDDTIDWRDICRRIKENKDVWLKELRQSKDPILKKRKDDNHKYSIYLAKDQTTGTEKIFINLGKKYQIGSGSYKTVYKAIDYNAIAIKALGKTILADERAITLARAEAQALQALPNSERVLQSPFAGELQNDAHKQYLFMPFCEMGELFYHVIEEDETKRLKEHETNQIMMDIIDGVLELHNKGWVHQDIKPENIFLYREKDGKVRAKVGDLGFTRPIDADLGTAGTYIYLSPEKLKAFATQQKEQFFSNEEKQLTTPAKIANEADVWSVGLTLYGLLYNENPFFEILEDDDQLETVPQKNAAVRKMEKVCADELSKPVTPIQEVIFGLLNFDPTQRMTLADASAKLHAMFG